MTLRNYMTLLAHKIFHHLSVHRYLVWIIDNRKLNKKINKIHGGALRIVYGVMGAITHILE